MSVLSQEYPFLCRKYLYCQSQYKKNIGEQKLKWLKLSVKIQRLGFEFPSGRDIFCLKNSDTSTRTSVRVSEMNAAARAQLTWL